MEPKSLETLVQYFERLPGVGKKTALRYAYYIIEKMNEEDVSNFSLALETVKSKIHPCPICGILTDQDQCDICNDHSRNQNQILVVKDSKEALAIEKMHIYFGTYHVLGNLISPLNGIGPRDINIDSLMDRCHHQAKEIILATPFTPDGETTALFIKNILAKEPVTISKIGYGLPAFGDIEYADELTLNKALEKREPIK